MTRVVFNEPAMEALVSTRGVLGLHMTELADKVKVEAERLAPYDAADEEHTHVRDAIEVQVLPHEVRIASTAADSKGRPVGLFVEVGTSHSRAQPYLRPAFDAVTHH